MATHSRRVHAPRPAAESAACRAAPASAPCRLASAEARIPWAEVAPFYTRDAALHDGLEAAGGCVVNTTDAWLRATLGAALRPEF